jgi:hypothetical protein
MAICKKMTLEALEENADYAVVLPIPDDASKELLIEIMGIASGYQDIAQDEVKEKYLDSPVPDDLQAEIDCCYERWNLAAQILKNRGFVQEGGYGEWITEAEDRKRKIANVLAHPFERLKHWQGHSMDWRHVYVSNGDVSVEASVYHSCGPFIELQMRSHPFEDPTRIYIWPEQAVSFAVGLLKLRIHACLFKAKLRIMNWYRAHRTGGEL